MGISNSQSDQLTDARRFDIVIRELGRAIRPPSKVGGPDTNGLVGWIDTEYGQWVLHEAIDILRRSREGQVGPAIPGK